MNVFRIAFWCLIFFCNTAFSSDLKQEVSKYKISIDALYLQSNSSSHNIGGYKTNNNFEEYLNVGNIWGWGFKLGGKYYYRNNRDIAINWYAIDNKKNTSISGPMTSAGGALLHGPEVQIFNQAKWNAVNLEFAHTFNLDDNHLNLRLYPGLSYLAIKEKIRLTSPGTGTDSTYGMHAVTYNGFGPRLGVDLFYHLSGNFSVYANTGLSLFVGTARENNLDNTADNSLSGGFVFSTFIVPGLEEKLGVNYIHKIESGQLYFDAGWMWINYFQALISRLGGTVDAVGFGFQGPYVGLKFLVDS